MEICARGGSIAIRLARRGRVDRERDVRGDFYAPGGREVDKREGRECGQLRGRIDAGSHGCRYERR